MADSDVPSKCRDHSAIGREAAHSGLLQPLTIASPRSADLADTHRYRTTFRQADPVRTCGLPKSGPPRVRRPDIRYCLNGMGPQARPSRETHDDALSDRADGNLQEVSRLQCLPPEGRYR